MVSAKSVPVLFGLFALASAQLDNINTVVNYNVIKLLNETHFMGVVVDNITYPLIPQSNVSILHSGEAPVAKLGYSYVKIEKETNNTEIEPFLRSPSTGNTINEFYKRSWNKRELAKLPTIYEPLSAIHRIQSQLHIDGEIPTIHLVGNQTEIDHLHASSTTTEDVKVMTNMTYVSLNDTLGYTDVEISLAGRSSKWMSKLSYNLKLGKKDRLYDYRRLKLRALATDPSYIREQLAYDVLKSVGLVSSEFSYCRVLLNDREIGLFGIIDTFKDPWLANVFGNGDEDYEDGYLYQGVLGSPTSLALNHTSDLSYYDNVTAYADGQYKIKVEAADGKKDNYKPLMKLTKFIQDAPTNTSDAVTEWKKQIDTDAFLRSMALEVIMGYADGHLATADNYYLYQNPDTDAYFYISSDMDLTMGSTMFKLDDMWSGNYSTFPGINTRILMTKMLQVPEFNQQYNELLVNITKNLVNPVVMNNRINDVVDMLEEDINWDKSLPRVGVNILSDLTSSLGENSSQTIDSDTAVGAAIGNTIPFTIDWDTILDFGKRMNETIPLKDAVNGPTGHASLAGVKEWVQKISENILAFYNVSNATTSQ
ncbi:MAG: coth protein-domain-containing protein [Benjaminiella poitrasii]|nr:MAG: coth protein-domain-containing protein [Benjaminiella poitrasii]